MMLGCACSGYGGFGFGGYGFGNNVPAEGTCPAGGESWCYNPLVMYIQQHYPGVLSKGNASDIRDKFKVSLKDYGYIPGASMVVLQTPTQAVANAVAAYQPALADTVSYRTLLSDAVQANTLAYLASGGTLRFPIQPAPAPTTTMPRIPLIRFPTAAAPAPAAMPAPAKVPWTWIGAAGAAGLAALLLL